MNFKRFLTLILVSSIFIALPVYQLMAANNSAQTSGDIWVWKFDVGTPYMSGNDLMVDLSILAMDTNMQIYGVEAAALLDNEPDNIHVGKLLGKLDSGHKVPVVLIEGNSIFPHGPYRARITVNCWALGKSETVTINFTY